MLRSLVWLMAALVPIAALSQTSGGLPALREDLQAEAITRATSDAAEAKLRLDADVAFQSQVQAVQANVTNGLSAEKSARQAADAALQTAINNEVANRAAAETSQANNLNAEVTARQAADTATLAEARAYTDAHPGPQGPTGPQGIQGPPGPAGLATIGALAGTTCALSNTTGVLSVTTAMDGTVSMKCVAPNAGITCSVARQPEDVTFDGTNIWVATDMDVEVLRANDCSPVATYVRSGTHSAIVFDGAYIWVTNWPNTVSKLRPADGAILGTFVVGNYPSDLAFDGANIWVASRCGTTAPADCNNNSIVGSVTKLSASDGSVVGTFTGDYMLMPMFLAFDGANIWVSGTGYRVHKLRALDGELVASYPVMGSSGMAFDGANIWVANRNYPATVTKLRASDGADLGAFPTGNNPIGVLFDGAHIWVANNGSNSVTKIAPADGAVVGTYPAGRYPFAMAFDGANIWVTNRGPTTISKLPLNPP